MEEGRGEQEEDEQQQHEDRKREERKKEERKNGGGGDEEFVGHNSIRPVAPAVLSTVLSYFTLIENSL
jgi:hypothetical protein